MSLDSLNTFFINELKDVYNAEKQLVTALRQSIDRTRVELHELDLDINDHEFGLAMANRLHELYQGR